MIIIMSDYYKWVSLLESVLVWKVTLYNYDWLQAIFEVITSEASYHLNLTTLIDDFMDDPKMSPSLSLSEGEKVLDRTQHSTIFSNVKDIKEISARYGASYVHVNWVYIGLQLLSF